MVQDNNLIAAAQASAETEAMMKTLLTRILLPAMLCTAAALPCCSRDAAQPGLPAPPQGSVGAPAATPAEPRPRNSVRTINGCTVVTLEGTPEQIGTFYGKALGPTIKRLIDDMILNDFGRNPAAYQNVLAGTLVMEQFQPKDYLAELRAIADSAGVPYENLLMLQYFGDVRRAIEGPGASALCTSLAILPPNTREPACIVGRNFDYYDNGAGEYASIIAHYRPKGKIPFVTITWAGIINGWTLINERGMVFSNNTCWGDADSLEGISTCFLLRHLAEEAATLREAVEMVNRLPLACGTAVLIASGRELDAAIVEFDHKQLVVRRPIDGFVGAGNGFEQLYRSEPFEGKYWGRVAAALEVVRENAGRVDLDTNVAGREGVPITSMNLHCANIDATNLRFRVAMGRIPAFRLPFKAFRITAEGVVEDGEHMD